MLYASAVVKKFFLYGICSHEHQVEVEYGKDKSGGLKNQIEVEVEYDKVDRLENAIEVEVEREFSIYLTPKALQKSA